MRRSLVLLSILLSVGSIRHNVRLQPERRNRMLTMHRRLGNLNEIGQRVCFDHLGCFSDRQPLALKRPPQHPSVIKTEFYLYTRANRNEPDQLEYGDKLQSMKQTRFNASKPLKVVIHGYKGSGKNAGVDAFLDLEDANVIVVNWARGAGSSYGLAVSNTELVGRQLGLILSDAVDMGVPPARMHLVGFSLGAHVAGCASEVLKKRGHLPGRITGLDPASPFFRHHLFRDKSRKLDASDARLVDVVHTDGSSDFSDGFGLLKPIGHIDFFPNGGRQQPGCKDIKHSVVVSHLNEDSLDINIACSHVRSWFLFEESLVSQKRSNNEGCKFHSWPCKRRYGSFQAGSCFPPEDSIAAPELGYAADRGPQGLYYLATRSEPPYCGLPLRASVKIADSEPPRPRGVVTLALVNNATRTVFKIICDQSTLPPLSSLNNRNVAQPTFYDIKAANYEGFSTLLDRLEATVKFDVTVVAEDEAAAGAALPPVDEAIYVDRIAVEDRRGNSWRFCGENLAIGKKEQTLTLTNSAC
uniref:phospholipase A1 n=1 Tax=Trichogramma kaykai TaxID=54128 RepID=A0ABD2XJV1_9HYME